MDDNRFDDLARALGAERSRRQVIKGLAAVLAGAALGSEGLRSAAAMPNEDLDWERAGWYWKRWWERWRDRGCKSAGKNCKSAGQCCSGLVCEDRDCTPGCRIDGDFVPAQATGTTPCLICNPDVSSTSWTNNDGVACDDGNACTQTDACQGGLCVGSNPVACTALDQCHVAGVCDPATGACANPNLPDGTSCNDGNACTSGDTCQSGVCQGGTEVVCTTDNPCLIASCDMTRGCIETPKERDTPCDDGTRCDGREICDGAGNCVEGTPVTCDPCNACDPETGSCVPAGDGESCPGDGNRCFGAFVCSGGACVGVQPVVCTALDQCHDAGTCDPLTGECSNPDKLDSSPCNDGNTCTSGDTCQAGIRGGSPVVCPPDTACTTWACNGTADCTPTHLPGNLCDDGDACTSVDTCRDDGNCGGTPVLPTLACPADLVQTAQVGACGTMVDYALPTATCANGPVVCQPASGSSFAVGTHVVTCTATNAAAGQSACSFSVTVTDDEASAITCPTTLTGQTFAGGSVTFDYPAVTASDNCAGVSSQCQPPSGTEFGIGTHTVTCTATAADGDVGTCSFTVQVTEICRPNCAGKCAGLSNDGCGGNCPDPCEYQQSCCYGTCYDSSVVECYGVCAVCGGDGQYCYCVPATYGDPPRCLCY